MILFSFIIIDCVHAQFTLHGKVTNSRLEPLAFASIRVSNSRIGSSTKETGEYKLELGKGLHEITVTMVGFKPVVAKVFIEGDKLQNFILEDADNSLQEVRVQGMGRDKAEEYVRNVIKNKEAIKSSAGAHSYDLYIKAVRYDSTKLKKKDLKKDSVNADFDPKNMSMTEISARVDFEPPSKIKEERKGISRKGSTWGLFYLTATEGRFNIYDNLIKVPSVSAIPFVSPVSYSGLIAYRYKTVKTEKKGNHNLYTISYRPTSVSNATVIGTVVIDDSAWVVLHNEFTLPKYHLPEYDFFQVEQTHEFVKNKAWLVTKERFNYFSKSNRGKSSGATLATYSNFDLDKIFPRRYFGNEISASADSAYKRDSVFWNTVRAEPLSPREIQVIRYRDSIYNYTHSKAYLDSLDKSINKITWQKILYKGQSYSDHEKGVRYNFPSLAAMVGPYVFSFGGMRIGLPFSMVKTNPVNKKSYWLSTDVSYGFLNKDVNGRINFNRLYNPFTRAFYSVDMSRGFVQIFSGDAWINQISRRNYYLDNSIGGGWGREVVNGLTVKVNARTALRRSLSNYKTYGIVDTVLKDVFDDNKAPAFQPYNAFYGSLEIAYTPFQPYIREPNQKINLESKWPTAFARWEKGVPNIFSSDVNFDYLEFGFRQFLRLGTAGVSNYTVKTGSFLNQKELKLVDYKYQRRGDPFLFMNPEQNFQALGSTFPVFKRFYEGHYFHEFNGAILNRIPLFKKIGLREVGGTGFLIAPEADLRYFELFTGIERVFKMPFQFLQKIKVGAYVVSSYANKYSTPVQFKFGITTWDSFGNRWR